MATFPGKPPNPLGVKVEISLAGVWTDITLYVMLRSLVTISNMGRADESNSVTASSLTLTLKNDGRFTPKNSSGAYYPNIVRNTPVRVSVNATSTTGVAYSGYRYFGEIAAWPPGYDTSQRDVYVQVTASGIWRRIAQAAKTIGSSHWRYVNLLTGTAAPAAYWAMEDGSNTAGFVLSEGTGTNIAATGTPSYAADNASFGGSNAIPQLNAARLAANVSSAATPTDNVIQFALSVPAAGDSTASTFSGGGELVKVLTSGTVAIISVSVTGNQLVLAGKTSGGSVLFTGTIATKVNGVPVYVSVELTPSGSSVAWAMRTIKPNAASVLDQVSGTLASSSIAAVTQVQVNDQGRFNDTALGQLGVWYTLPVLTTAAAAVGGHAGEFAVDRFNRICAESNIPAVVIGSASAAMGPQTDDTMANVLQGIEDTDGGLLFEPNTQFGLGYRTLASMQNQSAVLALNYAAGVLGAPLAPTYDDALLANTWTVTNWDGYAALAQLTSGAISVQPPPNGVGSYSKSKTINASTHAQVNAIAQQLLFEGTVDDLRYPLVTVNFLRSQAAPQFAAIPALRIGDYFQITNMPAFLGGGTAKQLAWGYTETMGSDPESWTIVFNAIPELPFETTFSPGVFSVTQAASGSVAAGSGVGSSVSGAQLPPGSVGASALSTVISARSIGGMTQFIAAATPYDWTFAVTGTPADANYFTCTEDQSLPIAAGDTFTNSGGLGGPFTVTSVDPPAAGNVNVHFTPAASSVMSTGTVFGGKNGDEWVNTSGGNQVNIWAAGAWSPVTWNAANVITAGSITASQIAAGIVIAGVVNGTTITGATIIADGTSGEILVYSGTPALGNLIGSWSGAAGTDGSGNSYPAGLAVEIGGLVLFNQSSAPSAVSGASSFYSSIAGRPRFLSQSGNDSVLERSTINVSQFTLGNTLTVTAVSAPLSYLANEGNQSSEYEIEIDGIIVTGSGTASALTFGLAVDGTILGGQFGIGAVFIVSSKSYAYTCRFRLSILTSGAGGTVLVAADGTVQLTGQNIGNSNVSFSASANSGGITKNFDTTANHTLQVVASWVGTSTGQSVTTYRTRVARLM